MNKLAVFVEGLTEQEFMATFIQKIFASRSLHVQKAKYEGRRAHRRVVILQSHSAECEPEYFIQIVNCGTYERVASDVRDSYGSLAAKGFAAVIAVRDVQPTPRTAIGILRNNFNALVRHEPIPVTLVLATMEVEAWFLAEHTHLTRIHGALTPEFIHTALGFNPAIDDMETRERPSADLANAYWLVQLLYEKRAKQVQRTVAALDCDEMYHRLPLRVPSLRPLTESLGKFFA